MISKKVILPEKFILYLETQPEQGMGYHIVNIYLNDDRVMLKRIVFNSTYLNLKVNEKLNTDDIIKIEISESDN